MPESWNYVSAMITIAVLLACEHAGNSIRDRFKPLFSGSEELLKSHKDWILVH